MMLIALAKLSLGGGGATTWKVIRLDWPPPVGKFETEMLSVLPKEPRRAEAGVAVDAVNCVSETSVVATSVREPFHCTLPLVKPLPFTVRVSEAAPALILAGESEEMWGPMKLKLFRLMSQAPRPCVPARRVREGSWRRRE